MWRYSFVSRGLKDFHGSGMISPISALIERRLSGTGRIEGYTHIDRVSCGRRKGGSDIRHLSTKYIRAAAVVWNILSANFHQ
jgi:hypothetical protein